MPEKTETKSEEKNKPETKTEAKTELKTKAETGKPEKTEKLEREYVIPLRKEWRKVPRYRRTSKAVKAIKEFLVRHMKIRDRDLDKIKLDRFLNEDLWTRGIRNPPNKIAVKVVKEGEIVRAELLKMPDRLKFKKAREEKINEKADKEAKEKKKKTGEQEKEKEPEEGEREKSKEEEKEKEEKKAAVVEAGKEIAKTEAKKSRHQTVAKKRDSLPFRRKAMMK